MRFASSTRAKRWVMASGLALMLPALTGCAYLRLLHFKNQLKAFDENVSVLPNTQLAFEFAKPIVKNSDFVFITGSQPSRIEFVDPTGQEELWSWNFQKIKGNDSDRSFQMTFRARFENDLLTRLEIDDAFVGLFGKDFTEEIFSRMGFAKINKLRRSVTIAIDPSSLAQLSPPSLNRVVELMGEPTEIMKSDTASVESCRYEFRYYNPKTGKTAGRFSIYMIGGTHDPVAPIVGFKATGRA
jgi:hypothetical protein